MTEPASLAYNYKPAFNRHTIIINTMLPFLESSLPRATNVSSDHRSSYSLYQQIYCGI